MTESRIALYWIPLVAGGVGFVRFNGRVYEAFSALHQDRRPMDLYHTALEANVPEGRFTIENGWPSPDRNTAARGVVLEGPCSTSAWPAFERFGTRCAGGAVV